MRPLRLPAHRNARREKQIVNAILTYLALKGHLAIRINSGRIRTESGGMFAGAKAGTADIICCRKDGRFVAIEVKDGKNKPTQLQQEFLNDVARRNGETLVAWSVDDVIRAGL